MSKMRRSKRIHHAWGLFNYDTLYEIGRVRLECRQHAERIIGKDFERYFRDGSMTIRKVTVREGWPPAAHGEGEKK